MESAYGVIVQAEENVTGRAEITLKTTPAAGKHDFWGGALRVSYDRLIAKGRAILQLEDGRCAKVLVDSVQDDPENNSRLVTFLGLAPLQHRQEPVAATTAGRLVACRIIGDESIEFRLRSS